MASSPEPTAPIQQANSKSARLAPVPDLTAPGVPQQIYAGMRADLIGLVGSLTQGEAATMVPVCPLWSVTDVLAHVVGINADFLAENMEGVGGAAWTQKQVDDRDGRTIESLCEEWLALAPKFDALALKTPRLAVSAGADLIAHIHDVLGALSRSGDDLAFSSVDGAGVWLAVQRYAPSFCERAAAAELPPVVVSCGDLRWQSGETSASDPVTVRAPAFELCRAFTGRRSESQILAMSWTGDATPYVAVASPYGMPNGDVVEGPTRFGSSPEL